MRLNNYHVEIHVVSANMEEIDKAKSYLYADLNLKKLKKNTQ